MIPLYSNPITCLLKSAKATYVLIYLLFSTVYSLQGQQIPLFDNFRDNPSIVNPAMTIVPIPIEEYQRPIPKNQVKYILNTTGRLQWTDFGENSPRTFTASFQTKIDIGRAFFWFGPYFIKDQIGPSEFTSAGASASVSLYLKENTYISAGLVMRYFQFTLDQEGIITRQPGDPTIANNLEYNTFLSPGLGLFYTNSKIYAGLSIPYVSYLDPSGNKAFSNHYHALVGGFIPIGDESILFEPSASYQQAVGFDTRFDGNAKLWYYLQDDTPIWVGIGFNNASHYRVEVGFMTDSNPQSEDRPPFFKVSFAYGNQIGLITPLGNVFEAGINIMFP